MTFMRPFRPSGFARLCFLLGLKGLAFAQVTPPNAGDVFRTAREKAPAPPPEASGAGLPAAAEKPAAVPQGGPLVEVKAVRFQGNTVYSSAQLSELIKERLGERLDMADMKSLARRISDLYRENGYPFARAVIPVQEFQDGVLQVTILEGRYDVVKATGEAGMVEGARIFLEGLRPGDLMESGVLERTMLIVDDIPGVAVRPSIRPGTKVGTSELDTEVWMETAQGGDYGFDNSGSRYTGYGRAHLSGYRNSLLKFGDKLSGMVMATDLSMLLGSVDYEAPWGGRGLRWQVGYAHTTYELGEEYAVLGASGLAKVWTSKLSYPLLRSQVTNLSVSAGIQHKDLQDDFIAASTRERKSTLSLPVALRFDHRDNLFSGAVSYGMLSCTLGRLSMDDVLAVVDAATARKAGTYLKFNLDLARIQSLGHNFVFYTRISAQWADKNLDSSERLGIGGAEGVRAYPLGEGAGDAGLLGQVELRYELADYAPYLFFDAGSNQINAQAWDAASDQSRSISGAGVGLRYEHDRWSANLAIAYRIHGGAPNQDVGPDHYRVYVAVSRTF
jgi:hemolysin activation/secretion protein